MCSNGSSGFRGGFLLAAVLSMGAAVPVAGQVEIQAREASLRIGGRLHTQFAHSSVGSGPGANIRARRAWLTFDARLNDWLSGRVQHDFVGTLKDAYVRFTAGPRLRVDVGHFKRAFGFFVLQSSADISVLERDGRIPGFAGVGGDGCAGVGNVCSLVRLTDGLLYVDRDVGVRLQGELGDRLSYQATLTNGTAIDVADENDAKSPAGRVVYALTDRVRLGANATAHDYVSEAGTTEFAGAWGADLEVGTFESPGVHLQAGVVGGENWRVVREDDGPASFLAAQAILSYHRAVGPGRPVTALEPLFRVSWADPGTEVEDDGGLLLTPGFMVFFARRTKIGANVDVYRPQEGETEWSLKVQTNFYF